MLFNEKKYQSNFVIVGKIKKNVVIIPRKNCDTEVKGLPSIIIIIRDQEL
jgi:hypothetical protein